MDPILDKYSLETYVCFYSFEDYVYLGGLDEETLG